MGENRWRSADAWPLPGTTPARFSLGRTPDGRGVLAAAPSSAATPASGTWSVPSDPSHPIIDPFDGAYGAHDYRALATRADVMTFDSAPFDRDTRVVGRVEVQLTVSADVPDVDVYARIFDVAPDGTAWNLMSPGLEVTRRSARANATPVAPGERVTLTVGHHLTGNLFRAGHRLRVVVMPSFFPHFSVNPQTGRHDTGSAEVRRGSLTVHFGPDRPSHVVLPVVAGEGAESR